MVATVRHKIPFHDVDSLQIVWHGHYYKYFELARTALYQSCNMDIPQLRDAGYILPVIESSCKYIKPLVYNQSIIITARFQEYEYYFEIVYEIICSDSSTVIAKGHTRQACCDRDQNLIFPLPGELTEKIIHD